MACTLFHAFPIAVCSRVATTTALTEVQAKRSTLTLTEMPIGVKLITPRYAANQPAQATNEKLIAWFPWMAAALGFRELHVTVFLHNFATPAANLAELKPSEIQCKTWSSLQNGNG